MQIDPGYVSGHEGLADALKEQGKTDEAIEQYRKVLAINPNNGNAQRRLRELGASVQ